MNKSVCAVCRRFEPDTHGRPNVWTCAEHVWLEKSDVIPGHSFTKRNGFHYITAECPMPKWCERTLEQTILSPEETVEVMQDDKLVYDGNDQAEFKRQALISNTRNARLGTYISPPVSSVWLTAPITDDVFK